MVPVHSPEANRLIYIGHRRGAWRREIGKDTYKSSQAVLSLLRSERWPHSADIPEHRHHYQSPRGIFLFAHHPVEIVPLSDSGEQSPLRPPRGHCMSGKKSQFRQGMTSFWVVAWSIASLILSLSSECRRCTLERYHES